MALNVGWQSQDRMDLLAKHVTPGHVLASEGPVLGDAYFPGRHVSPRSVAVTARKTKTMDLGYTLAVARQSSSRETTLTHGSSDRAIL